MNITFRSLLSALFGGGLMIATIASAVAYDIAASSTLIAFSLLTVYGLVEMAILSYGRAPSVRLAPAPAMPEELAGLVPFQPSWNREPALEFAFVGRPVARRAESVALAA